MGGTEGRRRLIFHVPYITRRTHDDVTWALGWVGQEGRGLLAQAARYPARLAAIDAPNIVAFTVVENLEQFTPTPAVDRMIERTQTAALLAAGTAGRELLHDIDVYVRGANDRLRAEGSTQAPYERVDVFAANALISLLFREGGGAEPYQAMELDGLRRRLGARRGAALFDDLTGRDGDPDTP